MAGNGEKVQTRVCVTGAGGFLGSWIVKSLLSKGYLVHGTVRDPSDEKKNGHLKKMENASKNLQLFKADLFDYEGMCGAISGCTGVIHAAAPVPFSTTTDPQAELLEPVVTGNRNVLQACLKEKVKKVVVMSTLGAVWFNQNWPKNQPMDETCWNDLDFLKTEIAKEYGSPRFGPFGYTITAGLYYALGKTMADQEALEFGRKNEINIITVCPALIIGPMLHSLLNSSSNILLSFFKGESVLDRSYPIIDVRDVADGVLLLYENPESEGRYICSAYDITPRNLVDKIKKMNIISNHYDYPKEFTESDDHKTYSSKKLQDLGWKHAIELDEIIVEGVHNLVKFGYLPKA